MAQPPHAPPAVAEARALVEFLAAAHGVTLDHATLDTTARRLAAATTPPSFPELVLVLAAEAGLSVARVRRALADVLDDADPAMPWIALRQDAGGVYDALAVLESVRGGARVVVPGAHARPGRWSRASLRLWLGLAGDADVR